ncbi:MAG: hypothetical protein HYV37_00715 [Candidatus Levyibacteriota bacterium]|nr:MAG: hypothetical protein HYV37_00715 [Candidatus Levybacteria bacterium]
MKKIDAKKLIKYEDQYVAFKGDKSSVLAFGITIKELEKKLDKLEITNAIISYIPPIGKSLSPLCQP